MAEVLLPTQADIEAAHTQIAPFINRTPVLTSTTINELCGASLFFKCENFQKVGAFKMRGATNAVLQLTEEERANGVATHSSGNHAQALALAAKLNSTKAYIVMPRNAPAIKRQAVEGYGAEVIECEPTLQAREHALQDVVANTGATFIHPYNDYRIIAGQATAAKELFEDKPGLNCVITPVGGGGLLSGTALAGHYYAPNCKVYAGEPEGADDAYRSLKTGTIVPSIKPDTIADGLLTSLGEKNFEIIQQFVTGIITVSDDQIIQAMRMIWERMKCIVEPSAAVPLAAIIERKKLFNDMKVGVILSGGNADPKQLPF